MVTAELGEHGVSRCSGVLIAPTLVLTNVLCLGLPAEVQALVLEPPVAVEVTREGERSLHGIFVDYTRSCTSGETWRPLEDGSFAARLGDAVDSSSLLVSVIVPEGVVAETSTVRETFVAVAESRCAGYLAMLALDVALAADPVPVRLQESAEIGDNVQMSGIWSQESRPRPHTVPAIIEETAGDRGSSTTPPLSLKLSQQLCDFESGGPVVAEDTGALIGIIATPTGENCGDPLGRTIATRVAPFKRLLIDTVLETHETLRVEAQPGHDELGELPACVAD
jgi:hypothetical protein